MAVVGIMIHLSVTFYVINRTDLFIIRVDHGNWKHNSCFPTLVCLSDTFMILLVNDNWRHYFCFRPVFYVVGQTDPFRIYSVSGDWRLDSCLYLLLCNWSNCSYNHETCIRFLLYFWANWSVYGYWIHHFYLRPYVLWDWANKSF